MKKQHTLKDGTILKIGQKYILGSIQDYKWVQITSINDSYFNGIGVTGKNGIYSNDSDWLYYFDPLEERTVNDKLIQSVQDYERQLKAANKELKNENLTMCESRLLHVEIEKLNFTLNTLKFIQND